MISSFTGFCRRGEWTVSANARVFEVRDESTIISRSYGVSLLIAYNPVYGQGLEMAGAALESITHVLIMSTVVAFMTLVAGVVLRGRRQNSDPGFLEGRPFAYPAIAFIITALLVMSFFPIPMSEYHGRNELQDHINGTETIDFRVYDSIFYSDSVEITVAEILDLNESLRVELEGYVNDTLTTNSTFTIDGTGGEPVITHHEFNVPLEPGLYEFVIKVSWYEHGVEISGPTSVNIILSQPMASGMFSEVLQWQTYQFLLLVLSILLLIGVLCITTDKENRPKEGYERRWDLLPYG